MTEKEKKAKLQQLDEVGKISWKLFRRTGHIAYYGAICGARDLKREYLNDNNQINER